MAEPAEHPSPRPQPLPPWRTRLPTLTIVAALGALASCALTDETYPARYARAYCTLDKSCDREEYDRAYDGKRSICRDEISAVYEDFMATSGCSVLLEEAERCLDAMGAADCDSWHQRADDLMACEAVWRCGEDTGG